MAVANIRFLSPKPHIRYWNANKAKILFGPSLSSNSHVEPEIDMFHDVQPDGSTQNKPEANSQISLMN